MNATSLGLLIVGFVLVAAGMHVAGGVSDDVLGGALCGVGGILSALGGISHQDKNDA